MASNESKVLGMDFIAVPMAFLCSIACSVGDAVSDGSEIMGAGVGSMEGAVSLKIIGSCGSKKSSSSSASSSIPNCSEMVSKNSSSVVGRFLGGWGCFTGSGSRCRFGTATLNGGLDQIDQGHGHKDQKWNKIIHRAYFSGCSSSPFASDSRMEVSAMIFCMR